jgi:peptide/nickel transport system permease protein
MWTLKPVVLWSDALLALLLASVIAFVFYVRARPPLLEAWRRVGGSAAGMSAATVLLFFLVVGVLDSLHYRPLLPAKSLAAPQYSVEVKSALDALLAPLRERSEKTYSAPLAAHLFAKETVEINGQAVREFPRLKHGGAHLKDPAELPQDVTTRLIEGMATGAAVWLGAVLLVTLFASRGVGFAAGFANVWAVRTVVNWRAVLITLLPLALVIGAVAMLAQAYHVFGTDKVGQDVLYLSLKSVRTAILIGTLTTLVMLPLAVFMGILAGYCGGWLDDLIQYLYTVLNSIPGVLLIAAAVLMLQVMIEANAALFATAAERADARLLALCAILGLTSWTGLCRLLRGETLKLRELEYVQAARAFGVSGLRIMWRHVMPNVMHIVLIAVVMDFSALVLAEAVLSYVGIGVDPNTMSFGSMINAARMELARDPMVWWSLSASFVFMFLLVLCANLFADAVRDAFDPRLARRVRLPSLFRKA